MINNAANNPQVENSLERNFSRLENFSLKSWKNDIEVSLTGSFLCSKHYGLIISNNPNGGSIINISSTASEAPSPSSQPYGAAKAGLNALTGAYAHAYGDGVRVNCIMAGPFLTDISKAWDMPSFEQRAERAAIKRGGKPEEIIGAALYFAGKASSYTTGATLRVDGGWDGDGE